MLARTITLNVCASLLLLASAPAKAADVVCDTGGDAAGHAVAAGVDFDGDGVGDVAVGAPCARVGEAENAGRVFVHSGATGGRILALKGSAAGQKFGGALAFVDDVSGDGKPDLIVGSPGAPIVSGPTTKIDAGKVEVFDRNGNSVLAIEGAYSFGNFGEAVAGLGDYDGDDVPDLLVGAGGDRDVPNGERYGAAYMLSGADGAVIDLSLGDLKADHWGAAVAAASDVNHDGVADVLVSSSAVDTPTTDPPPAKNVEDVGLVRILSGADLSDVLVSVRGALKEKLGKSSTPIEDLDNDGTDDFAAGAPGVMLGSAGNAGVVTLRSGVTGSVIRTLQQPTPQVGATFGTAIASLGRINADTRPDIVASAPSYTVDQKSRVGRIHLFSGSNGTVLWTQDGFFAGTRFGQSLARTTDWDGDGRFDVAVGSPGDAFRGRRGAGSVRILSGKNGNELARFGGRRGLETRLFLAAWNLDGSAEVRAITSSGMQTKQRQEVLRGVDAGTLSADVMDDGAVADPNDMKLVLGGGAGAPSPLVDVVLAGRRRGTVSQFRAEFSADYTGGVNVAAGDLTLDPGEEIAVAQAESPTGTVEVSVYSRVDTDPFGHITWGRQATFPAFTDGERVDGFLVDANGASVTVGALADDGDRLVVAPVAGAPVVRVMDAAGVVSADWVAYSPSGNSGTTIAVGKLGATGLAQIVTAPRAGQLRIRAFNADGTPFISPDTLAAVDFVVPTSITGAATSFRLAIADVDLDDRGEIIVVTNATSPTQILAFEADGTLVEGWPSKLFALQPLARWPVAIAATDRFVRR